MRFRIGFLLPAVLCLLCLNRFSQAQPAPLPSGAATGVISGVVHDPSGALVGDAAVDVADPESGFHHTASTDRGGHFTVAVAVSRHLVVSISAPGFSRLVVRDVSVGANQETKLDPTLHIATANVNVEVGDPVESAGQALTRSISAAEQARSRNSAEIVAESPGVSLRSNGQYASMPMLHGMGDERTRVIIDGASSENSCPNHMNPPLSYVSPAQTERVTVMAGITPVSTGGDSLGGTIVVDSAAPVFAGNGKGVREEGSSGGFYRSNGSEYGGSVTESIAGKHLALGYTGRWSNNGDYTDGGGHRVTSTYAQSTDHMAMLAFSGSGNLVTLQGGLHHSPYEGFVNAQMDMVRNYSESLNLHWQRALAGGALDTRVFWQNAFHAMNVGRDKLTFPMPMWMPMNTHGRDLGYAVRYERVLSPRQSLRVGNEFHRFVLDDRWPPVAGTAPYMGPDAFVNINNGRRIRLGTYAEVVSQWTSQWTMLAGIRNDTVWTNADPVQGYSSMYAADADAFNAAHRAHTDPEVDITAMTRDRAGPRLSLEGGYARKNRTPNLYERYAWSTSMMASGMIGWFGDGNYYVGNPALKPEHANAVSGTVTVHSEAPERWSLKLSPYATFIDRYIDVDSMMTEMYGMSTFAQLRFANHRARIVGSDLSGRCLLLDRDSQRLGLSAVGAWVHGTRTDSGTPMYQMMPLNLRLSLDEDWRGFTAALGMEAVDRKSRLDPNRLEQATPGYTLFHLRAEYRHGFFDAGVSADNLFDRLYELHLGGVNFDDFMASMWMAQIKPLTGRGRSIGLHLTAHF